MTYRIPYILTLSRVVAALRRVPVIRRRRPLRLSWPRRQRLGAWWLPALRRPVGLAPV